MWEWGGTRKERERETVGEGEGGTGGRLLEKMKEGNQHIFVSNYHGET